jgi:hypothetical protein
MERQIKLSFASNAARVSFGREASRITIVKTGSATRPNVASCVAPSASSELLRACDILRDVLLRDDEELTDGKPDVLIGQVSAGVQEIVTRLQSLAGLQMMFEAWNKS